MAYGNAEPQGFNWDSAIALQRTFKQHITLSTVSHSRLSAPVNHCHCLCSSKLSVLTGGVRIA